MPYRELEILNEVGRIATLDLELRPMLQRITDALSRKFDWEFVALVSVNAERTAFQCEALTSSRPTVVHVGYSRPLGSGVVGEVAASGKPIVIDDVSAYENYVETMQDARAEICVPIRHKGELVAILNLESTRIGEFHDQLPLLTTIGDQIAGAIASARLHEELERKTRALEEANAHLAKAIETLHRLSTEDPLTGVANRRMFDDTLSLEWRRAVRTRSPLALLLVDIDHFKQFNDAHGHPAGDERLRAVAGVLRDSVHRAADLVARYGGEEFALLLPETDLAKARALAETLRCKVMEVGLTVSIGVASEVPDHDVDHASELVRRADEALYEAKRGGRNRVV